VCLWNLKKKQFSLSSYPDYNWCDDTWFKCDDESMCINPDFRCDGDEDCEDGTDEKGCPWTIDEETTEEPESELSELSECSIDQFECKNGECILLNFVCDGDGDCSDRSDETDSCNGNDASMLVNANMLLKCLIPIVVLLLYV
jgi:hypothetical protein